MVWYSPDHLIKFPSALMRTLFGSDFCGLKLTTVRTYVGILPDVYIFTIWASFMTKMQFLTLDFFFLSSSVTCPIYFPNLVCYVSLFSGLAFCASCCTGWRFPPCLGAILLQIAAHKWLLSTSWKLSCVTCSVGLWSKKSLGVHSSSGVSHTFWGMRFTVSWDIMLWQDKREMWFECWASVYVGGSCTKRWVEIRQLSSLCCRSINC